MSLLCCSRPASQLQDYARRRSEEEAAERAAGGQAPLPRDQQVKRFEALYREAERQIYGVSH